MKKLNISLKSLAPAIEKIERLSKLQRILIYAGTVVVLVGAFVYFSYMPKLKEIGILKVKYKDLEIKLKKAKKNARQLDSFRSQMKAAETKFKIAKRALPDKKEIPALIDGISQAAQDSGLDILVFTPKPEVRKEFYAEVPISIKVAGNYHNVAVFFDMIAGLPRIVSVTDIAMVPAKDANELTTSCTAVTYRFVEPDPKSDKGKKRKKK
ncbi:MAG: type 4a pilus biogenesis protein PilO [Deltaproteobacteria bacterium]|nr:type 4a pilus biogenesis protein PilO [Deltaproteobacteria bacterium]RLB97974.1 MAG: protein PilO [Deltaproteobacteria bacterium]